MYFIHFLSSLCVLKSRGNQFVLVYTMAGLNWGLICAFSLICIQVSFWDSATGGTFVSQCVSGGTNRARGALQVAGAIPCS